MFCFVDHLKCMFDHLWGLNSCFCHLLFQGNIAVITEKLNYLWGEIVASSTLFKSCILPDQEVNILTWKSLLKFLEYCGTDYLGWLIKIVLNSSPSLLIVRELLSILLLPYLKHLFWRIITPEQSSYFYCSGLTYHSSTKYAYLIVFLLYKIKFYRTVENFFVRNLH